MNWSGLIELIKEIMLQKMHQVSSSQKRKRYGILGGTFDPVHIGHLILAHEAMFQLELDSVLWVLTPYSPHKDFNRISDIRIRLDLLDAALRDNQDFCISDVDIVRPPPHYAVDTLQILRFEFPEAVFIYLMGGDSLRDLPSWRDPEKLLSLTDEVGVMGRPGYFIDLGELEMKLPEIQGKVHWIDAPKLEISSSQIREKIKKNQAYRYYLHPAVYKMICESGLYR
jgi:nicotinate-nucleotide adenylyltransferase